MAQVVLGSLRDMLHQRPGECMRAARADNHWALNGGPFTFPMNIRLTSVRNDTVRDVLQSEDGGQVLTHNPTPAHTSVAATAIFLPVGRACLARRRIHIGVPVDQATSHCPTHAPAPGCMVADC